MTKIDNAAAGAAPPTDLSEAEQLKARLAEIKEQEKALREKQKAEREEARVKREKEEAETAALRQEVTAELADIDQQIADLKARRAETAAKLPKGTRGSGSRTPKDPNRLSAIQTRILTWMHGRKSSTRQEMVDAGTGKEGGTLDGSVIGNLDESTRSPHSLLGRGLLEVEEVENDGAKAWVYSLTSDGKKAAKAARDAAKAAKESDE